MDRSSDINPAPRRIVGLSGDVDDPNIIPQRNMTIYQPLAQVAQVAPGPACLCREEGSLRARPDGHENRSRRGCD